MALTFASYVTLDRVLCCIYKMGAVEIVMSSIMQKANTELNEATNMKIPYNSGLLIEEISVWTAGTLGPRCRGQLLIFYIN